MNNIDLIQLPNQFINSYDNIGSLISFYCRIILSEKNATECITEKQWLNILGLVHSINNKFKFELKDEEKTKGFLRCSMRATFLISIIITETDTFSKAIAENLDTLLDFLNDSCVQSIYIDNDDLQFLKFSHLDDVCCIVNKIISIYRESVSLKTTKQIINIVIKTSQIPSKNPNISIDFDDRIKTIELIEKYLPNYRSNTLISLFDVIYQIFLLHSSKYPFFKVDSLYYSLQIRCLRYFGDLCRIKNQLVYNKRFELFEYLDTFIQVNENKWNVADFYYEFTNLKKAALYLIGNMIDSWNFTIYMYLDTQNINKFIHQCQHKEKSTEINTLSNKIETQIFDFKANVRKYYIKNGFARKFSW